MDFLYHLTKKISFWSVCALCEVKCRSKINFAVLRDDLIKMGDSLSHLKCQIFLVDNVRVTFTDSTETPEFTLTNYLENKGIKEG